MPQLNIYIYIYIQYLCTGSKKL